MKKLKLNLDDLKVESFETSSTLIDRGTVVGQSANPTTPGALTCSPFGNTGCGPSCLTCNGGIQCAPSSVSCAGGQC